VSYYIAAEYIGSNIKLVGAIVGGGIGGILLISMVIMFLCRRKKRQAQEMKEENPIDPFMVDISTPTPLLNKDSLAMELQQPGPMLSEYTRLADDGNRPTVILTTRTRMVRREEDGGSIHGISELGGESAGTLPPDYDDLAECRRT